MTQIELPGVGNADHYQRLARNVATATRAALRNAEVRSAIAAGALTEQAVRNNPPVCVEFEHGQLYGSLGELAGLLLYSEKRRLGEITAIHPIAEDEPAVGPFTMVLLAPNHPRRIRFAARARLKKRLGRQARVVTMVGRLGTQKRFVDWVAEQPGLSTVIRKRTGLSVRQLWRRAKGIR